MCKAKTIMIQKFANHCKQIIMQCYNTQHNLDLIYNISYHSPSKRIDHRVVPYIHQGM